MADVTISSTSGGGSPVPGYAAGSNSTDPGGLGAGLSFLGSGIASSLSVFEQLYQNKFNAAEAEKNRKWQEYMSSTAVERYADSLERAGFNRILAAGGGQAAVPSGSSASSSQATPASTALVSGMGAMSQVALNAAQARLANSSAALNDQQVDRERLNNIFNEQTFMDRWDQITRNLDLTSEQARELKSRIIMQAQLAGKARQETVNSSLLEPGLRNNAFFESHGGQVRPYLDYAKSWLNAITGGGYSETFESEQTHDGPRGRSSTTTNTTRKGRRR